MIINLYVVQLIQFVHKHFENTRVCGLSAADYIIVSYFKMF